MGDSIVKEECPVIIRNDYSEDELDQVIEAAALLMDTAITRKQDLLSKKVPKSKIKPELLKEVYEWCLCEGHKELLLQDELN